MILGSNYIPSNAINQLEMWGPETWDPFTIDKELSWASDLNFNTIRVFLHNLLWEEDAEGFIQKIDTFLGICSKYNIKPMFVLFDSVWNPHPKLGTQPHPTPNVHNSGWVQAPGFDILNNPLKYDDLHSYVTGIVSHFKDDDRIHSWDLFNEPDNENLGSYKDTNYSKPKRQLALLLLQKVVKWVRTINPSQSITMGVWQGEWSNSKLTDLDRYMLTNSDIISYHWYGDAESMEKVIFQLKRFNKPIICTEYMARPLESTFETILPIFQKHDVGAINWGFVKGKSQTHCSWDSWKEAKSPEVWFHDIFFEDGTPYDIKEIEILQNINKLTTQLV